MQNRSSHDLPTLAIDPCSKGFGFVVLEGTNHLVDWGIVRVFSRNEEEFLARIDGLIEKWQPVLIIVEDIGKAFPRARARAWIASLVSFAISRGISVTSRTRDAVRQIFALQTTSKHDVATVLATMFPELEPSLPRRRRIWDSEDERINIFDALALAVAAHTTFPRSNDLADRTLRSGEDEMNKFDIQW